jgi:flavine halogenase
MFGAFVTQRVSNRRDTAQPTHVREDPFDVDSFTLDTIDGLAPSLERGKLGLVETKSSKLDANHFYSPSFLD